MEEQRRDAGMTNMEYFRRTPAWIDHLPWGVRRIFFELKKRALVREKVPLRLVEKRVVMELEGTLEPGMSASGAFASFKRVFYDKIESEEAREYVRKALLNIIRSRKYAYRTKVMAAHACADTGVAEAMEGIHALRSQAKPKSHEEHLLKLAIEALNAKKTIYEVLSSLPKGL